MTWAMAVSSELGRGESRNRRLKVLRVTPELVSHLAGGIFRVVENDIPNDAKVAWAYFDQEQRHFCVVLEHYSFPLVREGEQIVNAIPPMIERIQ